MIKRILKPSFRLKSAHTVVFSPCGKYLAQLQDCARITLWDVKERVVIAKHKLIKNENYIGFSPDSSRMYCKNGNGELVFFETLTGKVISETGKFNVSRLGGTAKLISNELLFDGDSNGQVMVWETNDSSIKNSVVFKNHMVRGIHGSCGKSYVALVYPKYDEKSSGCRLMKFYEPFILEDFELIKPFNKSYEWLGNWKKISKITFSIDSKEFILVLDKPDENSPQVMVQQDLKCSRSGSFEFDEPNEYTWSLSSNDKFIFVIVWTILYQTGMSNKEYEELKANTTETKHIHIFDKDELKRVAKIYWPDVSSVAFHPNNKGIAIAADKNSVYLDDYSVLLDL